MVFGRFPSVRQVFSVEGKVPQYAKWLFSRSTGVGQAQERKDRKDGRDGYFGKELGEHRIAGSASCYTRAASKGGQHFPFTTRIQ